MDGQCGSSFTPPLLDSAALPLILCPVSRCGCDALAALNVPWPKVLVVWIWMSNCGYVDCDCGCGCEGESIDWTGLDWIGLLDGCEVMEYTDSHTYTLLCHGFWSLVSRLWPLILLLRYRVEGKTIDELRQPTEILLTPAQREPDHATTGRRRRLEMGAARALVARMRGMVTSAPIGTTGFAPTSLRDRASFGGQASILITSLSPLDSYGIVS